MTASSELARPVSPSGVAVLLNVRSGEFHPVAARFVVGRSPQCDLRLTNQRTSSLHAELLWDGRRWILQDLGSRNGTFVDGRRLAAGELTLLDGGMELAFGVRHELFRLVESAPPKLMARAMDGETVVADSDLLCLPSAEMTEVTIFRNALGEWTAETREELRALDTTKRVFAAGRTWTVYTPDAAAYTQEASEPGFLLSEIKLEFAVSLDEEHIACRIRAQAPAAARELEPRAHNALLLLLARARLAEQQGGLPSEDQGWIERDALMNMLKIDLMLLNLWVYRARQQWLEAGVANAAGIIERRSERHQLRIGVSDMVIGNPRTDASP